MSCYLARRAWNFWLNLSTKVSSMKTFNELAGGDFLEFDSLLTFGEFIRRVYLNIQSEITHERYYTIRLIIYVRKGNETLRVLTHVMTRKVQSSYQILSIFARYSVPDPPKLDPRKQINYFTARKRIRWPKRVRNIIEISSYPSDSINRDFSPPAY